MEPTIWILCTRWITSHSPINLKNDTAGAGKEAEATWGPEHPDTLMTMANLAVVYRYQGRYNEAESLCSRALGGDEKTLGSEHPDTLKALDNLGIIYLPVAGTIQRC